MCSTNSGTFKRLSPRALLLCLAAHALPGLAFQPLLTDDTGTQGTGANQLEFSFSEERAKTAGDLVRVQTLPLVYTRGVSETIDLFAGIGYSRIRSSSPGGSGYGNPSLGAKWRFYENEESKISIALKPEVIFPVSAGREDTGLGTGKTSGNLTFIVSQEVPFGAVHFNAGVGRDRYRDTLANPDATTWRASLAPVWEVSEEWKLALDLGSESARAAGRSTQANYAELGAIYSPDKDLDLALGCVRRADNASPHTTTSTVTAGLTWRFK
jgi:hypothetical protein